MPPLSSRYGSKPFRPKKRTPRARPAPVYRPTPAQIREALARERSYGSQGRQLKTQAGRQKRAAKHRRQTAPGRYYQSLGRQISTEAHRQRVAAQHRREVNRAVRRVRRPFPIDRSEGSAFGRAIGRQFEREIQGRGILPIPRRTVTSAATSQLKREIQGRGALVEAGKLAKKYVAPGVGKATSRLVVPVAAPRRRALTDIGVTRVVKDFYDLPGQAAPSVYVPAAGAFEAVKGRPQRLKKLLHDMDRTDPVWNAFAAGGEKVLGHDKAARKRLQQAQKSFSEHPGYALLEVTGGKGIVGRGAGTTLRVGGRAAESAGRRAGVGAVERAGARARRIASTEGPERRVEGTRIVQKRHYSRDLIDKGVQVYKEKQQRKSAAEKRHQANVAERRGEIGRARDLHKEANRVDPDVLPESEIKRQIDEQMQVAEDVRRYHRAETIKGVRRITKGRRGRRRTHGYHGTGVEPETILTEGLRAADEPGSNFGRGVYLGGRKHRASAETYTPQGGFLYGVNTRGLPKTKHGGEVVVRGDVPAHRVHLLPHTTAEVFRADLEHLAPYLNRTETGRNMLRRFEGNRAQKAITAGEALELRDAARAVLSKDDNQRWAWSLERDMNTWLEAYAKHGEGGGHGRLRRSEQALLSVVAQRIVKADKADIQRYIDELEQQRPTLDRSGRAANKHMVNQLQRAINDPKLDLKRVEHAADQYRELTHPTQQALRERGLVTHGQGERATLIPYAVRNMGARELPERWINRKTGKVVPQRAVDRVRRSRGSDKVRQLYQRVPEGVYDRDGEPLSNADIVNHMNEHGVKPPAFVSQAPYTGSAKAFYVPHTKVPGVTGGRRGGGATIGGTFDSSTEGLLESAARSRGLVDAVDGFTRMIDRFSRRKAEDGTIDRYANKRDADRAAQNLMHDEHDNLRPGAIKWKAVRIQPFAGRKEQMQALLDHAENLDAQEMKAIRDSIVDAVAGNDGPGEWALIPEAASERVSEHMNVGTAVPKTLQVVGQQFRRTVLPTSTSWLLGNVAEAAVRSAVNKVGPMTYLNGRRYLKALKAVDEDAYQEVMSRMVGGGHYGMGGRVNMRRGAEIYAGDTIMGRVATALGKLRRQPGAKQVADFYNTYTEFVMRAVNGGIETQFQTAMMAKALQRSHLMSDHTFKSSKAAVQDAVKGLRNTDNQIAFGREVDKMYGQYSKLSPGRRKMIAGYTPFIQWWLNAVHFVYQTLPHDHPVTTAVLADLETATDDWRKANQYGSFVKDALPGFLQNTIPGPDGGHIAAGRYTPFGVGPGVESIKSQVLPFWGGMEAALNGEKWTGQKLRAKNPDGSQREANDLEKVALGSWEFIKSTVPVLGQAQRVAQKGPKALNPLRNQKSKTPQKSFDAQLDSALNEIDKQTGGDTDAQIDKALSEIDKLP